MTRTKAYFTLTLCVYGVGGAQVGWGGGALTVVVTQSLGAKEAPG